MIIVTGASGHLGRHVVTGLLDKLPAGQVVAAARSPEKAADLGVAVRRADHDEPDTLLAALEGAETVLLISGSEVGERVRQHRAVIDAARKAGVARLVYTSILNAGRPLVLAPEHQATEEAIAESGVTFTILRNGWYHENYRQAIEQATRTGGFAGSAGDGQVASASRADFAAAAVAVLTADGHDDKVYELSGDTAWTYADLAAEIAAVTGKPVTYTDLSPQEHRAALTATGLPEELAGFLVAVEQDIKHGLLADVTGELRALTGRPTTPIRDTVAGVVSSL